MHTSTVAPIPSGSSRFPVTPRWRGKQPAPEWSPQRTRAIRALRTWEAAERTGHAPTPAECMGGTELRALASNRKAHAFPLKRPDGTELARMGLRDRHLTELAWVIAVEVAFKREALLITHADMAALVGCKERTAGNDMRHLAGLGLVVALPMFIPGGVGHAQLACAYRVSDLALTVFGVRPRRGASKNCQPTETPASLDPKIEGPRSEPSPSTDTTDRDGDQPSQRVRTHAPEAPDGAGSTTTVGLRGAGQLARMLTRELVTHKNRIERELRGKVAASERAVAAAHAARNPLSAASPPREVRAPLDLGDLHPDDAAWLASRATGVGAGPAKAAVVDDFEAVIARANEAWARRNGGRDA